MTALKPCPSPAVGGDAALHGTLHGNSANSANYFLSMMQKDHEAHRSISNEYLGSWDDESKGYDLEEAREARKSQYMGLVNNLYDLVTDLYEQGWARSFHFCRFAIGEGFLQALARHEHYMASKLHLDQGMKVLDVGCGVGGPAREIASFTGCSIVGLNNNGYQIERATKYTKESQLEEQIAYVKGNFMNIDTTFPAASFDAAYAIEATPHAPSLSGAYAQIRHALKPGARVGIYEWATTDAFDEGNARHRALRLAIERGNAIPHLRSTRAADAALRDAGFALESATDLAAVCPADAVPWYYPLSGEWRASPGWWRGAAVADWCKALRVSWVGRACMSRLLWVLERAWVVPVGTARTAEELALSAEALVEAGKLGIFTPMYFMVARKPLEGG